MLTVPEISSYAGTSVVVALIATAVLWRRQAKQGVALGFARMAAVYVFVLAICLACICALVVLSRIAGLHSGKRLIQGLWIVSGVVAYFVGGSVVVRLRRSRRAPPNKTMEPTR
jgi:Co/Zn/Cd efflux system component